MASVTDMAYWTAESFSYFLLFLGPIVLKDRLPFVYYRHFLKLSDLGRKITRVEIETQIMPELRQGLGEWVREYEK